MRISIQAHVYGETVAPHQPPGGVDQQRIRGPRIIKVNGRKQLPGGGEIRMRDDGSVIELGVLEGERTDSSDSLGGKRRPPDSFPR
jgi:hypothetical protein